MVAKQVLQKNWHERVKEKYVLTEMSDVEILRLHHSLKKEEDVRTRLTNEITVELVNRGWRKEQDETWTWKIPGD